MEVPILGVNTEDWAFEQREHKAFDLAMDAIGKNMARRTCVAACQLEGQTLGDFLRPE